MQIRAMHCEPGQHRPPAPNVPMDLLHSGFYIHGPKPETYLEKQRKSAVRGGKGNSLKCCLWGWDLQLLEIPSLEAQLQSSAPSPPPWLPGPCNASCSAPRAAGHCNPRPYRSRKQGEASCLPAEPPVPQFPTRTDPETSADGKSRKQLGHVGRWGS